MEMDPQERDSEMGEDSPVKEEKNGSTLLTTPSLSMWENIVNSYHSWTSHNDEDMSDGDGGPSGGDGDDADSCDGLRRHRNGGPVGHGGLADHGDVLAKLKMQVRDLKDDFENGRGGPFVNGGRAPPDGFQLPLPFPFPHPAAAAAAAAAAFLPPGGGGPAAGGGGVGAAVHAPSSGGSSHSSDGGSSASSHNAWSFEEQFKQLYEINDDPKRKEFLDDLFSFMQKRGTPINRLPIMAKSVLDLYELYNLVIARGGLVDVINKKLWQEIIKGLHLPSSITSAAFTLRTQYMKYLYPYECEKKRLSTPSELQAAIDGNRREGRRTSYGGGQYDQGARTPTPGGVGVSPHPTISALSLVSQQQQFAARMNSVMSAAGGLAGLHHNGGGGGGGALHPSHPQPLGQQPLNGVQPLPAFPHGDLDRMMDYVKLFKQVGQMTRIQDSGVPFTHLSPPLKEMRPTTLTPPRHDASPTGGAASPLDHFEMSRQMALWSIYNNNQPGTALATTAGAVAEPQKEPINLSETGPIAQHLEPQHQHISVKREPECPESPPPAKRPLAPGRLDDEEPPPADSSPPASPPAAPSSTHITINSRGGDGRSGDNSLVVSMELNGVTYQGVLFAQARPASSRTPLTS